MKKKLIIIILSFSNLIYSQEEKKQYNWAIKINAFQLIDNFSFPTLQLSTERKINSWSSVNAEFGYQIYNSVTIADTVSLKSKGFKANIEGRIYFQKLFNKYRSDKHRLFLGLQLFYRQNQKSSSITYRHINEEEGEYYYDDDFGVKKSVRGINLTFGNQFSIRERFILEPFIALGYMDRNVENPGSKYDRNKHIADQNDGVPIVVGFDIKDDDNEDHINIGFGVRLGYRF